MNEVCEVAFYSNGVWISPLEKGGSFSSWEVGLKTAIERSKIHSFLYEVSLKSRNGDKIALVGSIYIHNGQAYMPVEIDHLMEILHGS